MSSAFGKRGRRDHEKGGEMIILKVDSEEDPQHKVRVMETLEMEEHEGRITPPGHLNPLGVPRT